MGPFSGLVFGAAKQEEEQRSNSATLFLGLRVPLSGPRSGDYLGPQDPQFQAREWNISWLWTCTFAAQIARGDSRNDVCRGGYSLVGHCRDLLLGTAGFQSGQHLLQNLTAPLRGWVGAQARTRNLKHQLLVENHFRLMWFHLSPGLAWQPRKKEHGRESSFSS